jgi:hypothetical protein
MKKRVEPYERNIKYKCPVTIVYHSKRYGKTVTVPEGYDSDGATGASDIYSDSWWVHDMIAARCTWDDGTPITNWQASKVLSDILASEGRWVRKHTWFWATFLFGCKHLKKKNGWIRLKKTHRNKH